MRSAARDQGSITMSGKAIDASGGFGVAHPGAIPFSWVRNSTGSYTVNFDSRIIPTQVQVTSQGGSSECRAASVGPGTFSVVMANSTGAGVNSDFAWSLTALDRR